jgi:PAS domain S-box-containing protein
MNILIIDDSEDDARLIIRELRNSGYEPDFKRIDTAEEMKAALAEKVWDIILSDYSMPSFSGITALEILKGSGLDLPFIIVSGKIGEETAVELMKAGAHDYILKDNLSRLSPAIEREIQEAGERRRRRDAEAELVKAKEEWERTFDAITDPIMILDTGHRIVKANRAMADKLGVPPPRVVGQLCHRAVHGSEEPPQNCPFLDLLNDHKPHAAEMVAPRLGGCFFTAVSPLMDSGGELTGCVHYARDITEKKLAEEQLMLANAYNRSLIEASLDPLVTIGHDGRITDLNVATERVTGVPREELIGADFSACFTDPEKADAGYQLAFREGMVHDYELEIRRRDGHVTPVLYNASIYRDGTGNAAGVFAAARDISERRNLENQLRQAQKMEAVGTLAGGVAHEFNNIMTAVIGYGSLLKLKLADDAKLLPKVDALLQAADRAAVLVRSLLSFSCKEGSELKSLDLNELIIRVAELQRRALRDDIELTISPADTLLAVKADNSQIEQVLANLAKNAQDAMPKGGKIAISTASVELDRKFHETHGFGEAGRYAVITFSDSGEGMGEEIRQKIFEPFFTTREVGKGTGLGLSICYGIIKQHKGYILCESEAGKGTVFTIYLPMIKAEAPRCGSGAEAPVAGGTETILIAEDNARVREVVRELLEEYGYNVIEAVDGRDAMAKFLDCREGIDLIIMDVIMPRMNGRELYMEISRLKPGVKVIFSSGYTADVLPEKMKGLNGFPFLAKPFVPEQLLRCVRDKLDGR